MAYTFEWIVRGRRIGQSSCPGDELKVRFLQAWAWMEVDRAERQANVYGPGVVRRVVGLTSFLNLEERDIFSGNGNGRRPIGR